MSQLSRLLFKAKANRPCPQRRRRRRLFSSLRLCLLLAPCAACPWTTIRPPPRRRGPRARSAPPARSSRYPLPRARINTSRTRNQSTVVRANHSWLRTSKTGSYMCTRSTRARPAPGVLPICYYDTRLRGYGPQDGYAYFNARDMQWARRLRFHIDHLRLLYCY